MKKHTPTISLRRIVAHTAFAGVFVVGAFLLGIKSAGEIDTIGTTSADTGIVRGDMNGDGAVTIEDAILAVEITAGYRDTLPEHLLADPNGDFRITTDDVLTILRSLSSR